MLSLSNSIFVVPFFTSCVAGTSSDFLLKATIVPNTKIKQIDIKINLIFLNNRNKILPPFSNNCNKIMGKKLNLYNCFGKY